MYFLFSGDLEQHLMGMALVAGPAVAPNGGAVPRRLPDSPPVVGPQGGRSVGGARWRDWENGEELHSMAHPPPPLFAAGGQRVLQQQQQQQQRAMSQDPAENAFWQRSVVRNESYNFSNSNYILNELTYLSNVDYVKLNRIFKLKTTLCYRKLLHWTSPFQPVLPKLNFPEHDILLCTVPRIEPDRVPIQEVPETRRPIPSIRRRPQIDQRTEPRSDHPEFCHQILSSTVSPVGQQPRSLVPSTSHPFRLLQQQHLVELRLLICLRRSLWHHQ